jgi:hypothetical protein
MKITILISTWLLAASLLSSCSDGGAGAYHIDVVDFKSTIPNKPATGLVPNVHIDTNIKIPGPFGGNVKSRKPYSIIFDHVDDSFTITAVEITKVVVTYNDGTTDPGIMSLKLPLRVNARDRETYNSVSDPVNPIVKKKSRLILGKIPNVISRDEPFTLILEGRFIKDNGSIIPFSIRESYEPEKEKSTVPWSEAMESI